MLFTAYIRVIYGLYKYLYDFILVFPGQQGRIKQRLFAERLNRATALPEYLN